MSSSPPQNNSYLWVIGSPLSQLSSSDGDVIKSRFRIISPHLWQDLSPQDSLPMPDPLPEMILPYLRLFPHRLHLPEVYGVLTLGESEILLLKNSPLDSQGKLHPDLRQAWGSASSLRQVYWLWQILELWTPLLEQGVASSLFDLENIRVQDWRIRLRELYGDQKSQEQSPFTLPTPVNLQELGKTWAAIVSAADPTIVSDLQEITAQLHRQKRSLEDIRSDLNQLLLQQAAQTPLRVTLAGATDIGPKQDHNEDSYYPTSKDLEDNSQLTSHLMMVCDGIGGHEGGEVASQLAVDSLKLQVQALLAEIYEDPEIMSPSLVEEQITAMIRVANNLISSRNDDQGRESRQRMGTTLVMAIQLPQNIPLDEEQTSNSHELYIAHVGDSRAYWITGETCYQLTVDDDVATREVRQGHSLHREALQREDAGALTQALGTRDAQLIRPNVQRLILEENGVLLLCSDGLSDHDLLEKSWAIFAPHVVSGKLSLEIAVEHLMKIANEKNGHDNTSIIAASYSVSEDPVLVNLEALPHQETPLNLELEDEDPVVEQDTSPLIKIAHKNQNNRVLWIGGITLMILGGLLGVWIWGQNNPQHWKNFWEQFTPSSSDIQSN